MGVNTQAQNLPAPQQAQVSRPVNPAAPSWMSQYKWDPNWANNQAPSYNYAPSSRPNAIGTIGTAARGASLAKGLANYMAGSSLAPAALSSEVGSAAAGINAAVAPTVASDSASIAAANDAWLAAQPAAEAGSSAAGAGAADAAATAGGGEAGATGGAGLGAGAGAAAAFLPLGLTLWASQKYPGVQLGADYWKGIENNVKGGQSNPQFYSSAMEALNMPQNQVPQAIQQELWNSGYVPQGKWGMQAPSTTQQQQFVNQTGTQLSGGGRPKGNV